MGVNLKVNRMPIDEWVLVAAIYLRESALKLYIEKAQLQLYQLGSYFQTFLQTIKEQKTFKIFYLKN